MRFGFALLLLASAGCSQSEREPPLSGEPKELLTGPEPTRKTGMVSKTVSKSAACSSTETTIFTCKITGGKTLSVCGTADAEAEYRFGRDKAEITLRNGEWASAPYSGGGEAQIRFTNHNTEYVVFSRMVRTNFTPGEPNDPAISDGVIVLRDGTFMASQICEDVNSTPIQYDAAEALLPERDALFTEETIRADGPSR